MREAIEAMDSQWTKEFPGAITVCNRDGIITAMNEQVVLSFEDSGGQKLLGSNVLDCHTEPAQGQLKELLESGRTNVYTIEKNGVKKLIYQASRFAEGEYRATHRMISRFERDIPLLSSRGSTIERCTGLGGRIEMIIHENPRNEILHTVLVEKNGFMHAVTVGTEFEDRAGVFFRPTEYSRWIQP